MFCSLCGKCFACVWVEFCVFLKISFLLTSPAVWSPVDVDSRIGPFRPAFALRENQWALTARDLFTPVPSSVRLWLEMLHCRISCNWSEHKHLAFLTRYCKPVYRKKYYSQLHSSNLCPYLQIFTIVIILNEPQNDPFMTILILSFGPAKSVD